MIEQSPCTEVRGQFASHCSGLERWPIRSQHLLLLWRTWFPFLPPTWWLTASLLFCQIWGSLLDSASTRCIHGVHTYMKAIYSYTENLNKGLAASHLYLLSHLGNPFKNMVSQLKLAINSWSSHSNFLSACVWLKIKLVRFFFCTILFPLCSNWFSKQFQT